MRLPNGAWTTSCMPPLSSKKRSRTTRRCVGSAPSAARAGREVLDDLLGRRRGDADAARDRVDASPACRRRAPAACRRPSSRRRDTACESSSVRAGASPSQNGIVGGWPCASSTRTMPGSTRRIRHEALPSWKMSPAMLSMAKSSLTVPTSVALGLEHDLVVGVVGDRAAGGERGQARAAAAAQHAVDRVAMQYARARPRRVLKPRRAMRTTSSNSSRARSRYGYAPAHELEQRVFVPFLRGDRGDDLLRQDVERLRRDRSARSSSPRRTASSSAAHSTSSSRVSGKSRPFGTPPTWWPARPTRCRKRRDRARRAELADEVDVADVDAELERRRRDEHLELAAPSAAARRRAAAPSRGCRGAR